jgi:hypothetical protein
LVSLGNYGINLLSFTDGFKYIPFHAIISGFLPWVFLLILQETYYFRKRITSGNVLLQETYYFRKRIIAEARLSEIVYWDNIHPEEPAGVCP